MTAAASSAAITGNVTNKEAIEVKNLDNQYAQAAAWGLLGCAGTVIFLVKARKENLSLHPWLLLALRTAVIVAGIGLAGPLRYVQFSFSLDFFHKGVAWGTPFLGLGYAVGVLGPLAAWAAEKLGEVDRGRY